MKTHSIPYLTLLLLLIFSWSSAASSEAADNHEVFLQCLSENFENYSSISNYVYTKTNSSYNSTLQATIYNLRFATKSTPKPQVIITPVHESQIPPIILCAKQTGLEIRTRSGGHDFEGRSYVSRLPFVIIDLINLGKVTVDVDTKTAWIEAGATLGSVYYNIALKSPVLGFAAGFCPTVGAGGHLSGGGDATLVRKHGMAADQVIDARVVDAYGRILDRESMGEDLFWAIRGGGGASFGVIIAWKVRLVDVPETVTVFRVIKTLEQNATQLVHRWQYVAPTIDRDLFIGVSMNRVNSSEQESNITIQVTFYALFLGRIEELLPLMEESFPELGLQRENCTEMTWIDSVIDFGRFTSALPLPLESPEDLLIRRDPNLRYVKMKQDFVQKPVSKTGLNGMLRLLFEPEAKAAMVAFIPHGGRMPEISKSATPFPHRNMLYKIETVLFWEEDEAQDSERYMNWSRRYYSYMTPYVSRFPRAGYVNYRDLDYGVNNVHGETSFAQASIWGRKYFMNNFERLAQIKTVVDPENFFRHEQSIPTLYGCVRGRIEQISDH